MILCIDNRMLFELEILDKYNFFSVNLRTSASKSGVV